jgi:hypothetical protein
MMKCTLLLISSWVASICASPLLEKRQGPFTFAPTQNPLRYKETDGTLKAGSKHVNVIYGPFEIPAGKVGVHFESQDSSSLIMFRLVNIPKQVMILPP